MSATNSSPLYDLIGDETMQKKVRQLRLIMGSDNWIARFLSGLLSACENIGLDEMLQDPERVLFQLQGEIEELFVALEYAKKLQQLYPRLLKQSNTPEPPAQTMSEAA